MASANKLVLSKTFTFLLLLFYSAYCVADDRTLRVAMPNRIGSLNPTTTVVLQDRFINTLIFESLVELDGSGDIVNRLISSWSFNDVTKEIELKIQKGHLFSDGTPLKGGDVADSLSQLCRQDSPVASQFYGLFGCGSPSGPKIDSNHDSVRFKISIHPVAFIYSLAGGRSIIFKRKNDNYLGSGPFIVESLQQDEIRLRRNSNFKGLIPFGAITIKHVPESEILERLAEPAFDVASMYLDSTVVGWQNPNYWIGYQSPNVTQTIVLNPLHPLFRSLKKRRQIADAVREIDFTLCQPGTMRAFGWIPHGIGGSLTPKDRPELRVQKVRSQIIDKDSSRSVLLHRHIGRKNSCEETAIINAFNKAGVTVTFKHHSDYRDLIGIYKDDRTPGYVELTAFITRDPSTVLRRLMVGTTERLYFTTDKEITSLLIKALSLGEIHRRFEIYRDINSRIIDSAHIIPMYFVGHTNIIHRCYELPSRERVSFNINSLAFFRGLSRNRACDD